MVRVIDWGQARRLGGTGCNSDGVVRHGCESGCNVGCSRKGQAHNLSAKLGMVSRGRNCVYIIDTWGQ